MRAGVIFDMDGVLVDSGRPHRESWRVLARQYGITISDEVFAETFGMSSRDIIRQLWGEQMTDDDIRRLDSEKEVVYRELVSGRVPIVEGAEKTLATLVKAGYILAVGTSGPPENLELVLRETGFDQYFTATVHGFDVQDGKPAPDIFLKAAQRADLRPEQCVVIEDAPVGVQAAVAAGMTVIGYTGTHPGPRLVAVGAARVVDRLGDITPGLVAALL
ncbi:MAG: HAD family phosphatase [Planctomycetota bacterium]